MGERSQPGRLSVQANRAAEGPLAQRWRPRKKEAKATIINKMSSECHYPLVMSEASGGADCEFIHMKMIQISNDNQLIKKELYQYLRNLEFC